MSERRPLVIVTLPGRSVAVLGAQASAASEAGADAAEVRVDRLTEEERGALAALFPAPLPLVATYRSTAEGGEGSSEPPNRAQVLGTCARLPFRWIDLELRRDLPMMSALPPPDRLGRIVSLHAGPAEVDRWAAYVQELDGVEAVGKLVVPASVRELFGSLLPLLHDQSELVVHTTGPSGPVLRALARKFGFPFVYACLPEGLDEGPVEPSQIPVDRLRPYLERDPSGPLFGVVGHPVAHSLSPALHASWIRAARTDGLYLALDFPDEAEFVDGLGSLASVGFRGVNVTHPFKRAALQAATEVGASAEVCGAANCLTFRDGEVEGENTDLAAVLRRLTELRSEGRWNGETLAVVGSGGAARATLAAGRQLHASATILARDPAAAGQLAHEFDAEFAPGGPSRLAPGTLVVHATDVGRAGRGPLALPLARLLGPRDYVLDWVYAPESPEIRDLAREAGAEYENGSRLLVYQAAASYALWWGAEPSETDVSRALTGGACAE